MAISHSMEKGETDGKRKINLCALDDTLRKEYVNQSLDL
jgi:hypothetical protein